MTVARLTSEMSGVEMLEWGAFFKMENERRDEEEVALRAKQGAARAKARPRTV